MNIPLTPRYAYCSYRACEFLKEYEIHSFPVDVFSIIAKNNWGIIKYSELMKRCQCSREKVIQCLSSSDGYTQYDGYNYTIAYNDDQRLGNRIRFTLMHEIGHIYLNHLIDFEQTRLCNGDLSFHENRILENEANVFARNALAPVSEYFLLKNKSVKNVSLMFGITPTAAKTRIDFISRDTSCTLPFLNKHNHL